MASQDAGGSKRSRTHMSVDIILSLMLLLLGVPHGAATTLRRVYFCGRNGVVSFLHDSGGDIGT
jgi:hypothetical protein